MTRRLVALTSAALAVSIASPALAHATVKRRVTYCPAFGAHRGEGWPTPNTQDGVNAVQAAIDDTSITFLESDIWATSDGKGLMQHDNQLSISTSDGTGLVSDHTLAEEQALHMKDGTRPQSLPEFLQQVVSSGKHAVLHDKSSSLNAYIDAAMRAAGAHAYVRVMVASIAEVKYFTGKGWIVEYTPPNRTPTSTEITTAKAAGMTSVLIVDTTGKATPSTTISPWIAASVYTDYVTYNATQDGIITQYKFSRVMSGNLAQSRSVSGCP